MVEITTGPTEPSTGRLPTSGSWQRNVLPGCHRSPETLQSDIPWASDTYRQRSGIRECARLSADRQDLPKKQSQMTAEVKAIRVNLMFGKRTIAGLMDEFLARNPYARAKLIRKLALDGWRLRQGELGTAMPLTP